jgi:hypothetical protein
MGGGASKQMTQLRAVLATSRENFQTISNELVTMQQQACQLNFNYDAPQDEWNMAALQPLHDRAALPHMASPAAFAAISDSHFNSVSPRAALPREAAMALPPLRGMNHRPVQSLPLSAHTLGPVQGRPYSGAAEPYADGAATRYATDGAPAATRYKAAPGASLLYYWHNGQRRVSSEWADQPTEAMASPLFFQRPRAKLLRVGQSPT